MKKIIIPMLASGLIVIALILFMIPSIRSSARTLGDYELEGTILKSYKGSDDTISIPKGVTEIGPEAFLGNKYLTQVTIPSEVKRIDSRAFYGCKELARVNLQYGVESVGMSAFANCPNLYLVNISDTVTEIMPGAFCGCDSLSSIELSKGNTSFFYNDGVLYNSNSTELIQYLAGRNRDSFEVPFSVKQLDSYAFWGAKKLKNIRLSNNIKEIPDHAFSNCIGLSAVFLPESVKRIAAYGFSDCINLLYLAMENPYVKIAKTAFDGCNKNLYAEDGVSEQEAKENSHKKHKGNVVSANEVPETVSDNKTKSAVSENNAEPKKDKTEKDKAEAEAVNNGGVVIKGSNGSYDMTFTPKKIKNSEINKSDKDLVGAARVSGGGALIIPE